MRKISIEELPTLVQEKLHVAPTTGCWLSRNTPNRDGYTSITSKGVSETLGHRTVYVLLKGYIPSHLTLDHLCGEKSCVNPDHLEAVTRQENSRRRARAKHRHIDDKWKKFDGKTYYKEV